MKFYVHIVIEFQVQQKRFLLFKGLLQFHETKLNVDLWAPEWRILKRKPFCRNFLAATLIPITLCNICTYRHIVMEFQVQQHFYSLFQALLEIHETELNVDLCAREWRIFKRQPFCRDVKPQCKSAKNINGTCLNPTRCRSRAWKDNHPLC